MHYDKKHGAICKSVESWHKTGMNIDAFKQYLLEYANTIRGSLSQYCFRPRKYTSNFLKYHRSFRKEKR